MKYADYKEYLSPALAKTTELVFEKGKGTYITDVNGDEYLDFVQGIAVNALGHSHPKVVKAIQDQVAKLTTASFNLGSYPTTIRLAERLAKLLPGDLEVTFFSNGGAEANDGAIKLAKAATRRSSIIAFRGSFHGRTIGAASITGSNSKMRKHYEPLMGGVYFAPYPHAYRWGKNGADPDVCAEDCLDELQKIFDHLVPPDDVAAIIFEPVMGEGGYVVPPVKFVKALREICTKHGILLIFDEIQTGFARTGKMFACQNFDVVPDIIVLGKAIAGGLPMSAFVSTKEIMGKWEPGMHGTTFGGHPVCAAAAHAVLDALEEEKILDNVNKMGPYIKERALELKAKFPVIGDVRGLGMMVAMEFVNPEDRSPNAAAFNKVRTYCLENKLLILGCGVYGNGFRFATPLNVSKEELDKGFAILEKALEAL